ncbi:MAG: DUF4202 domain-containing protein [Zoogloeaceae bacterium]|jgi:hypothetical protein|nr:DUF4202 domain-containing protein [Zoogloeaceae bacterium]
MTRLTDACAKFDAFNAEDPNRVTVDGRSVPKELDYAQRMTHWLEKIAPQASEALRLAARAQHIGRWTSPRSGYPMGKPGYLKWRRDLYAYHAEVAGRLMADAGYDAASIARVGVLLRKENLKTDAEAQTLEDVACLVFLENFYTEFSRRYDDDKVIDILRKTWKKMSPAAHAAALDLAQTLPPDRLRLIERALAA